jgi:putative membrane-bound dehydrogenase-like protein
MTWQHEDGTLRPVLSSDHWTIRRRQILAGFESAAGPLPQRDDLPAWDLKITEDVSIEGVRRLTMTVVVEQGDRLPFDLYIPAGAQLPVDLTTLLTAHSELSLPAVVALHPTGAPGKRIVAGEGGRPGRQYGLELAQRGYVTICPDYPSFGEYEYDFDKDDYVSGTMKGIFNHMRCVDFLTALPIVDADRIGVIGHSLGGHNAMFLGMYDQRVRVIVSSCGWTPFHDYYGGDIRGWTSPRYMPRLKDVFQLDPDQVPFDFHEVVASLAPRAFVSVSPLHDANFDIDGVRKAIPEARKVYSLLGAEDQLVLLTPDCQHDFPTDMRIQAYAVIDRELQHTPTQEIAADYASELPRIAPLEPAATGASFETASGFKMQLTAAEPLVTDPVAMCFDADGRLFVVEMNDYSEQAEEHLGRIRLLTDEDQDGTFDQSTVYASGLSWPTAITCWDGGVFVGAAPDIVYLKDTTGDQKADLQQVIFTGFGRGNVQGLLNSFHWGPDNRIYGATSSSAGTVKCLPRPDLPAVNLRSQDFSFDPRTYELRTESGGAQHGACFDDWGNRFVCSNSDHAQAIIYSNRYLNRTPGLKAAPPRTSIAVDGGQAEVFRISPVEPWRIVRTRLRMAGMVRGPVEGGGRAAGYFTGSTGITVYRGDAWPASMKGTLIVGDVGSNIVHRKRAESHGVGWRAFRIDQQSELIASRDNWFRPVQFANGPDGCLHVLDMYREVIEHPASLPPEIKQHLDLTSGRDRGRLYRLLPHDFRQRAFTPLSAMSTEELVQTLDHPNGWHRDTAQRLLFERGTPEDAPLVSRLLSADCSAAGWLHALQTLSSWQSLTTADIQRSLQHSHPRVRERAVLLAEQFADSPALHESLLPLVQDEDARVRLQLALTAGFLPRDPRERILQQLLTQDSSDRWMRSAIFSSLGNEVVPMWISMMTADSGSMPTVTALELTDLAARNAADGQLSRMASALAEHTSGSIPKRDLLKQVFLARPEARQHAAFRTLTSTLLQDARQTVAEDTMAIEDRVAGIRDLRFSSFDVDGPLLVELLQPRQPPQIQQAAIVTLAEFNNVAIADALISRWESLSPQIRETVKQTMLSRANWATVMLQAIATDVLSADVLASAELQRLVDHPDTKLATLARSIVQAPPRRRVTRS